MIVGAASGLGTGCDYRGRGGKRSGNAWEKALPALPASAFLNLPIGPACPKPHPAVNLLLRSLVPVSGLRLAPEGLWRAAGLVLAAALFALVRGNGYDWGAC